MPPQEVKKAPCTEISMKYLFEDESVIVCIKPIGILSQESADGKPNMVSLLEQHCGCKIYPLHRLDREVSGVMVYAKSGAAAAALCRDISEGRFKKEYMTVVHAVPEPYRGEMRDLLFKDGRVNKSYIVKRKRRGVKEAVLEYEVLKVFNVSGNEYALVKVLLHTGRTHQIRVQFASRKHPVAGDRKYGACDDLKSICLWSCRVGFYHPKNGQYMSFSYEPDVSLFNINLHNSTINSDG